MFFLLIVGIIIGFLIFWSILLHILEKTGLWCKWFGHNWVEGYYQNFWGTLYDSYVKFDSPICRNCEHKESDIQKGLKPLPRYGV
jgi:hypothetical protein